MQHQISPFDENLSCALQNNRTFNGKPRDEKLLHSDPSGRFMIAI